MMNELTVQYNTLTAEEFISLWESVWDGAPTFEQVTLGLQHTLFRVSVWDGDKVVAMARMIGDLGLDYYIKDVVVRPEYQGRGIGRRMINELLRFINDNGVPDTEIFVVVGRYLCGKQILLRHVGKLEVNAAVLKIGQEQIHRLFEIVIVFNKLLVKHDIGNGRTATDAAWVNLGNRIKKRRKPLSVVPVALTKTEFNVFARKSAVGCCPCAFTEPFVVNVVAYKVADTPVAPVKIGLILEIFVQLAVKHLRNSV